MSESTKLKAESSADYIETGSGRLVRISHIVDVDLREAEHGGIGDDYEVFGVRSIGETIICRGSLEKCQGVRERLAKELAHTGLRFGGQIDGLS